MTVATKTTLRTMPTKINNKKSENSNNHNDSGDNNNNNNNNNLSEENVAKVVAVEVEACGVHRDEGGQGGVAASAE